MLLWSRPCAVFNTARRIDSIRERQDGFCVGPMVPLHMCTPVSDQGPNSFLGDLRKSVMTLALKPIHEAVSTIDLPGNPLAARAFSFHISLIGSSEKNKSFSDGAVVHIEVVFCGFFKEPAVSSLVALAVADTRASRAASRRAAIGRCPGQALTASSYCAALLLPVLRQCRNSARRRGDRGQGGVEALGAPIEWTIRPAPA
jgi:hypothetical protein